MRAWPAGASFEHLPTLEMLMARSGLKVAALRAKLKPVTRYKCSDNTVRYDDREAAAAIAGDEPLADELDETPSAAAAVAEPLAADPVQAALQLMNRTLSLFAVVVRERGDIVRLCCETIKTMGEPQKLGLQLVQDNVAVLKTQVDQYSGQWLDVLRLVHELHDAKAEREHRAVEAIERGKFRRETFDLAKTHLPNALEKFQLSTEAGLALEMLSAVNPDMLGPIIENALPEEMHAKAGKLVDILKARRVARRVVASEDESPQREGYENGSSQVNNQSTPGV